MKTIHATVVALGDRGVLLRGPSGSGKSDLALRLIADGAQLVADDQVQLAAIDGALWAAPPATIAGLIEVRGVGIVRVPYRHSVCIGLVADLVPDGSVDRLPEPQSTLLLGIRQRHLMLAPFEQSACAKIRLALDRDVRGRGLCAPLASAAPPV